MYFDAVNRMLTMDSPQQKRLCIYCDRAKPAEEFSLEHIFPQALGGALCSDLFKTREVCKRCNELIGQFVDGAFLRNWFIANERAFGAQEWLDLNSPQSVSPLAYMGPVSELALPEDEVCEMWLGPCGSHFYHIHKRDKSEWDGYAGGNPRARGSDPGRAYLALTTQRQEWIMLLLRSFKASFRRARRYPVNFGFGPQSDPQDFVLEPDADAEQEAQRLLTLPEWRNHSVTINTQFDYRFLAKLALGMGYKILGDAYLKTPYCGDVRKALWAKDAQTRETIPLRGANFLNSSEDKTAELMSHPAGYVVRLHIVGNDLALSLNLPSGKVMHVSVSNSPELWAGADFEPYRQGVTYLISPQLGRFVGPISLPQYIAHKTGVGTVPELQPIEAQRVDPATLPPCRTDELTA